jgi:peptidoglycan/LPS O-acetylase OafA/YrhL
MLRWLIGVPIALVAGLGTIVVPTYQWRYGWDRDTSLMGVVYLWIFAGAVAFLLRREAGRSVLLGATYAFATVAALLLLLTFLDGGALVRPLQYMLGVALLTCVAVWAGLRHRSVRAAMRGDAERRRTSGCS